MTNYKFSSRSRFRTAALGAVLSASLVLAACGDDGADTDATTNNGGDAAASSSSSQGNNGETVSLTHARGEAEYPINPEKIVAVGPAVDNLLALGITPAAVVQTPKDKNSPWNQEQLEGVQVIDQTGMSELPTEEIAKVEPDLIVGNFWTITDENYPKLSQIAPTLGAMGTETAEQGWKPQLEALGKIFEKEDEAKKVLEEDDKLFEDARKEMPGLEGKTAVISQFFDGSFGAVADPDEAGSEFIYDLGMKLPEPLTDGTVPVDKGRVTISAENLSYLDADFMVIYSRTGSFDEVKATPGYDQLKQVRNDAVVEGDEAIVAGLNVPTSLSRAWVLDQVKDKLQVAADAEA